MKKISVLAIFFTFFTFVSKSQISKGNWLVGGSANLSSTKYKPDIGSDEKITEINLNSDIGYFIANKFNIGLKPGLTYRKAIFENTRLSETLFRIGPFVRYYFLPNDKIVNVVIEGAYQYGISSNSANESKFSIFSGPVVYFNTAVGLEFLLGYSASDYSTGGGKSNSLQASIGFQFHLEKEK